MSDQPEALRLADDLERAVKQTDAEDDVIDVARWFVEGSVAELRRLHARVAELEKDAAQAISDRDATARLNGSLLAWQNAGIDLGKQLKKAEAERDALRADAERYRWLRDAGNHTWRTFQNQWGMTADQCDAAIDAARAALKETKE